MDLLQLLFLEFLVVHFEPADLVYAVEVDLGVQVLRPLKALWFEELVDEFVGFAQGEPEDLLAVRWRHEWVAGWVLV